MIDYSKGKIYKIVSTETKDCYIGSTCEPYLSRRATKHRYDYNRWLVNPKRYVASVEILKYLDAELILLENFPCESRDELRARERYWYDQIPNVNKRPPALSDEERRVKILDKTKRYYKRHREERTEYNKEYFKKNREKISEQSREYREKNKNKIKEKQKEPYICPCGSVIRLVGKSKHLNSIKHRSYLSEVIGDASN